MTAAEKLPVEYVDTNTSDGKPVVTLIGADISEAYLDDAEPSPTMEALSRLWRRIVGMFKLGLVLLLVGGVIGAQFGSRMAQYLRGEQLRILLALMVLAVCGTLLFNLVATPDDLYSVGPVIGQ